MNCEADMKKLEHTFFFSAEVMRQYREYQKTYFDLNMMLILFVFCFTFFVCRCNVRNPVNDGFYSTLSFLFTFLSFLLYQALLYSYLVQSYVKDEKSRLFEASSTILNLRWLGESLGDLIALSGTLGICTGMYARVVRGQCAENVTLWQSQRCNPTAILSSLPQDHIIFVCILPILAQAVINGMTFRCTVLCWIISTSTIVLSIIRVDGKLEIFSILSSLIVITITYKYEKAARLSFAHNRQTLFAEKEKRKHAFLQQQAEHQLLFEKNNHELEILAIKAEEECRLMEKEKIQMVALIGNVAHDLKTPLQSFLMDLESLRANVSFSRFMDLEVDDDYSIRSILTSLESTCCFMTIAINRSIDFAKVSRNIALVPHMETFNLSDALSLAVNVIRHLKSTLTIIVNPLPTTMCLDIISDKHWFTENILCLLSNAMKYSNGGIVKVLVEHVQATALEADTDSEADAGVDTEPGSDADADVDGALETTPAGRVRHVNLACMSPRRVGKSEIMISIEDTGIGISEDSRTELFQPFKQVQRLAGGTGLGLYSLSNRIKALNGSRGVSSRKDGKQGSMFWFTIPYRPDPHFIREPREESGRSSSAAVNLLTDSTSGVIPPIFHFHDDPIARISTHFFLVDDSPSILKVVGRALTNRKYSVETANNGSAGLDRLIKGHATQDFDVVLMDLQMPIMDGIEAVRRYREFESSTFAGLEAADLKTSYLQSHSQQPQHVHVPRRLFIIGMSANSDGATKQCALDAGMDGFLPKPFSMAELQPLVDHITVQ